MNTFWPSLGPVAIRYSYAEQELSQSLKRWFADHFRTYDAKLHEELGH